MGIPPKLRMKAFPLEETKLLLTPSVRVVYEFGLSLARVVYEFLTVSPDSFELVLWKEGIGALLPNSSESKGTLVPQTLS